MLIQIDVPEDQIVRLKPVLKNKGLRVKEPELRRHIRRIANDAILQYILLDGSSEYVIPKVDPYLEKCKEYRELKENVAKINEQYKRYQEASGSDVNPDDDPKNKPHRNGRIHWSDLGTTLLEVVMRKAELFRELTAAREELRKWRDRNKDFKVGKYKAMTEKPKEASNGRRRRKRTRATSTN